MANILKFTGSLIIFSVIYFCLLITSFISFLFFGKLHVSFNYLVEALDKSFFNKEEK